MKYELETIESIKEQLDVLPKGTVVYKNINGKARAYLQWKENGKTKGKYLKANEVARVQQLVEKRKALQTRLSEMDFCFSDQVINYMPGNTAPAHHYRTNVILGTDLIPFTNDVLNFKKRDCFKELQDYISGAKVDKICALYGLRRSGKTVMLKQALNLLIEQNAKAAYIKIKPMDTMAELAEDLDYLHRAGFEYIFIDEISLMSDFIDGASMLSDVYAAIGMKIVLSGTDSLGFWLASKNELYDRIIAIHTSYISYAEHSRLLGINDIDEYLRYGGTLKAGELCFDKTVELKDASFFDDESTRRYIDTAICYNIQNSLKNFRGGYFRHLEELYERDELTNAINRIIEDENHRFTRDVIEREFKSRDYSSAAQIARARKDPGKRSSAMDRLDRKSIEKYFTDILSISDNHTVQILPEHISEIKEYLKALELIDEVKINYLPAAPAKKQVLFNQPGLRFSQAEALVFSIEQNKEFSSLPLPEQKLIKDTILEDVAGRMLEEIVLLEISKHNPNKQVSRLCFADGDIDVFVYDDKRACCGLYEVKHSDKRDEMQCRHLRDKEKLALIEEHYGKISKRAVLYRGAKFTAEDGIKYINVQEFLKKI